MLDPLRRQGEAASRREHAKGARESEGRGRPVGELGFIFQGLGSFFDRAAKLASEATKGGR